MSGNSREFWERQAWRFDRGEPLRQVQRVQNGQPVAPEAFAAVVAGIVDALQLEPHHRLLDLCCGNGLITAFLAARCRSVVAVDFSLGLLREVVHRAGDKPLLVVAADATRVQLRDGTFDRILIAAALQHLDSGAIVRVFEKAGRLLRQDGSLLVTDIPDRSRMWAFFDDETREDAYFASCADGDPLLGTWIEPAWLVKLARYSGFSRAEVLEQPPDLPYAHYRFDLRCLK